MSVGEFNTGKISNLPLMDEIKAAYSSKTLFHFVDKHCAKCGLKKKHGACKCKLSDQNGEDTEEGPSQSSTMTGENKEQGSSNDNGGNFNSSVKSMDGLSTIIESRHRTDNKSTMKFDKNGLIC